MNTQTVPSPDGSPDPDEVLAKYLQAEEAGDTLACEQILKWVALRLRVLHTRPPAPAAPQ
ncbi:MAG: hypothetical protein L0Z62_31070 [Gemmataceae bacterium]|nr:hypothetical protein [Gemmataceae bacterium]